MTKPNDIPREGPADDDDSGITNQWCFDCSGDGRITIPERNFIGHRRIDCPTCAGSGRVAKGTPSRCEEIADALHEQWTSLTANPDAEPDELPFVITYASPQVECPECRGHRWQPSAAGLIDCWFCSGKGTVSDLLAAQHGRMGV